MRLGLFGKLPSHGDFVRRGDPALVERLDHWLSDAVDWIAFEAGDDLDQRLEALPSWDFRLAEGLGGALIASKDKIGRVYPLIACGLGLPGRAVATALLQARDAGCDAEATYISLTLIDPSVTALPGWSRVDETGVSLDFSDFPKGSDVALLWPVEAAR